jgi:hypothetical protein
MSLSACYCRAQVCSRWKKLLVLSDCRCWLQGRMGEKVFWFLSGLAYFLRMECVFSDVGCWLLGVVFFVGWNVVAVVCYWFYSCRLSNGHCWLSVVSGCSWFLVVGLSGFWVLFVDCQCWLSITFCCQCPALFMGGLFTTWLVNCDFLARCS